ncbi:sugar ABC transporter substrate-binding protein [Georgenia sp. AZ-5]|uniref:sugar ABC transporter substrate-binding protein n=1 Tax=Georgenia sp. AZ-5 TaxID=3367526 RepID=UPI0037552B0D
MRSGLARAAVGLAACTMIAAACNRAEETGAGGEQGGEAPQITIGAVSGSAANPAVQVMNDAMEERAEEVGVELLVETSEGVEEQIEKAEAMIAQGVDYLGLHPWDGEAVVPVVTNADAQGIKTVILIDGVPGVIEEGKALTFISGNEVEAAQEIGARVADQYPDAQVAIITGTPGNLSAENRTNGFKTGVEGSGVQIVAEGPANWARDEALRVAGDMINAHPDLDVIFANNDEMAFGALQAASEAGKEQIDIIGWNGTCVGLESLLNGDFVLEAVLPFDVFGSGLIDAAVDDSAGREVPPTIEPEVPVLTPEEAQAILDGEQEANDVLVSRLEEASAGQCE